MKSWNIWTAALGAAVVLSGLTGCFPGSELTGFYRCEPGGGCPSGLVCVSGVCAPSKCNGNPDCPPGTSCSAGACVAAGPAPEDAGVDDSSGPSNDSAVDPACLGVACVLPNARSVCSGGKCLVSTCLPGFTDANNDPLDGCESSACASPTIEACDGKDNDCDGVADEDFDLQRELKHCGRCNNECKPAPGATPVCTAGVCDLVCQPGRFNTDKQAENGCESTSCTPGAGGVELCNNVDDDCNPATRDGASDPKLGGNCTIDGVMGKCALGRLVCVRGELRCEALNRPQEELCNGQDDNCNGAVDDNPNDCKAPSVCSNGACGGCTPSCEGKQCGPNGCNGFCGTCKADERCNPAGRCEPAGCTPGCTGKQCGPNGCGGSCGTCSGGQSCNAAGKCTSACTPSCTGRNCGSDGCTGTCGTCAPGQQCNSSGQCEVLGPRFSLKFASARRDSVGFNPGLQAAEGTVELWAGPIIDDPLRLVDRMYAFSHLNRPPGHRLYIYYSVRDKKVTCLIGGGATPDSSSRIEVSSDLTKGHSHLAVSWRNGQFWCAVNGKVEGPRNFNKDEFSKIDGLNIQLGNNSSTPTQGWDGLLDEVRVSSAALYQRDFTPERRFGASPSTLSLWHLDEGVGTVIKDSLKKAPDGNINGAVWVPEF
ncbi:MAG: hypothetical protein GMKNLPBB_02607 [Myxococcota bacterium]|nr:hypothetical protein [Myxococcota bacterium]